MSAAETLEKLSPALGAVQNQASLVELKNQLGLLEAYAVSPTTRSDLVINFVIKGMPCTLLISENLTSCDMQFSLAVMPLPYSAENHRLRLKLTEFMRKKPIAAPLEFRIDKNQHLAICGAFNNAGAASPVNLILGVLEFYQLALHPLKLLQEEL